MNLKLPKINNNTLFTPTLILLGLFFAYLITEIELVERNYLYSSILSLVVLVAGIKIFVLTFGGVEYFLKQKKPALLILVTLLAIAQVIMLFTGINHLTTDVFPQITIQWYLAASILFFIQTFFTKALATMKLSIVLILIYFFSFIGLYLKWFSYDNGLFILFQQAISYLVLGFEITLLFQTAYYFIKVHKY